MLLIRGLNCIKSILQNTSKSTINLGKFKFATFSVRDLYYDNSHGETGTLNIRFIKHIALETNKHTKIIRQTIKYADFYPISYMSSFYNAIKEIPTEQLPMLIIFTYTYKTNADPQKFAQALNDIDNLCVNRLNEFDYDGLLSTLYAFMYLIPNKITALDFYKGAIRKLVENFNTQLPKETFVQVCYYLGLWKRNQYGRELMRNFLNLNLNHYLSKLDKMNFAIVANAAFKTSCVQSNENFTNHLKQEVLECDYTDDALLVTLIKSLRLERVKSEEIYEKLKSLIIENKLSKYEFKGLIHIFALFADGLWNDSQICKILTEKCLNRLEEIGVDGEEFNDIREKDIATFIWCCSHLRCDDVLKEKDLQFLEEIILSRIYRDKYRYCPDELIDSILSLWIMNYKSERLIEQVLNMNLKFNRNERVKLDSRFKLLMNCVQIERPEWLSNNVQKSNVFSENRGAPNYLLKDRENLNKLTELLSENQEQIGIKSIQIVAPINELNIANIKVEMENGQKIHIEPLEKNQMLIFDDKEFSLVQLKTRLLTKLGCNVVLIKPGELSERDELLDKLKIKLSLELENKVQEREIVA